MTRYIARRLILLVFTLFLVSLAVFYVIELLPGDTATIILGQNATPENIEVMRSSSASIGRRSSATAIGPAAWSGATGASPSA